jgi:hypothetical protein
MIKRERVVDEANSADKAQVMDSDQFWYLSVRYVVSLLPSGTQLTDWKSFLSLKAVIQVRTAL